MKGHAKLFLILFPTFALILSSCTKDNCTDSFCGEWQWQASLDPINGWLYPVEPGEYVRTLLLSENRFQLIQSETTILDYTYTLKTSAEPLMGTTSKTYFSLSNGDQYAYEVIQDTLYLAEQCTTCYTQQYVKR